MLVLAKRVGTYVFTNGTKNKRETDVYISWRFRNSSRRFFQPFAVLIWPFARLRQRSASDIDPGSFRNRHIEGILWSFAKITMTIFRRTVIFIVRVITSNRSYREGRSLRSTSHENGGKRWNSSKELDTYEWYIRDHKIVMASEFLDEQTSNSTLEILDIGQFLGWSIGTISRQRRL